MGFHSCHLCASFHREIWWLYDGREVRWFQLARVRHYRILDELQRVSLVLPAFCPILTAISKTYRVDCAQRRIVSWYFDEGEKQSSS